MDSTLSKLIASEKLRRKKASEASAAIVKMAFASGLERGKSLYRPTPLDQTYFDHLVSSMIGQVAITLATHLDTAIPRLVIHKLATAVWQRYHFDGLPLEVAISEVLAADELEVELTIPSLSIKQRLYKKEAYLVRR